MLGLPIRWLDEKTLTAAEADVTFTLSDYTIPAGSRHLVVRVQAQTSRGGNRDELYIQFNGSSDADYNTQWVRGKSSVNDAARTTGSATPVIGVVPASGVSELFGGGDFLIPHYAGTVGHKAVLGFTGTGESSVMASAGRWAQTAAITSVTIGNQFGNLFAIGSYFAIGVVDERYAVEEQILSGADGTFTFSTLPALQGDLVAVGYLRSDLAGVKDLVKLTLNSDLTGTNYDYQNLGAFEFGPVASAANADIIGEISGDNATARAFSPFVMNISQFNRGVNDPHALALSGSHEDAAASGIWVYSLRRNNIEAVTAVAVAPNNGTNFLDGSMMSLYYVPKRLLWRYVESGGGSPSITTPTIPSGFAAIEIMVYVRSDVAVIVDSLKMEFNGDTTVANYAAQQLRGLAGAVLARQSASQSILLDFIPGASATANVFGGGIISIPGYDQADRHKHRLGIGGQAEDLVTLHSGRWESTDPITSIKFTPDGGTQFEDGSVIEIWGVVDMDNEPDEQGVRATKAVVTPS